MSATMTLPPAVSAAGHPLAPHAAAITAIKPEAPAVMTLTLEFTDPAVRAAYRFQPGQFNMLSLPGIGESAITLSSDAAQRGSFRHTVRVVGNVTQAISRLTVGDVLGVRGPYGTTWPMDRVVGRDILVVAGGVGLPALRPALYHVIGHRKDYGTVQVLVGARTPPDLLYADEYDAWRAAGIDVVSTVDRAAETWTGRVGVVPILFYTLRPDPRRTVVFTCGPEIMMRFVIYEALARRIAPESIYLSLERNMRCGVGLCGRCQYGPIFICKNGPVLTYDRIEPFFGVEEF